MIGMTHRGDARLGHAADLPVAGPSHQEERMSDRSAWLEQNKLAQKIRELECERNLLAGENQRLRELLKEAFHQLASPAKRTMSRAIWLERARKEIE